MSQNENNITAQSRATTEASIDDLIKLERNLHVCNDCSNNKDQLVSLEDSRNPKTSEVE